MRPFMAEALAGIGFVALFVLVGAGVVALLHARLRPEDPPAARASGALRSLEPRGGRHRFHARLFEVACLAAAWTTAIAVLGLWTQAAERLTSTGRAAAATAAIALATATWWAWRRGALRAREVKDVEDAP
jgi:hypothetical protein